MANKVRTHGIEFLHTPYAMGYDSMIKGDVNFARVHFMDDFLVDTLNGDAWASSVGNGGVAPAVAVAANGTITTAVNAIDNDCAEVYGEANWYAQQACIIEARFQVNVITTVGLAFGFANAAAATNDEIAAMIASGTTVSAGTNVTDAVLFVYDTDGSNDKWYMAAVKDTSTVAGTATSLAPVNATYAVYKIMVDTAGNAGFFINGACVGCLPACVTTTVALRPYFGLKGNATAARLLTIDYVRCSQDRAESSSVVW